MIKDKTRIIPTEEAEKARDKYRPDRDPDEVLPEYLDDVSIIQGITGGKVDLKFRPIAIGGLGKERIPDGRR